MGWTWNIILRVTVYKNVMRRVIKYEYIIILFVFLNENVVYAFLMSIKIS